MSTAVATVRAHPDKYKKDFNAVVAFLTQYIDKRVQTRPSKQQNTKVNLGTFKRKIKLKKYSREEHNSMLMAQHQQLYEHWKKAGLIKDKKIPESSRALEARASMIVAKKDNSSNEKASLQMKCPKLITGII